MNAHLRLSSFVESALRCPVCTAALRRDTDAFVCTDQACATSFPVVHGIPILLNEHKSIFEIKNFTGAASVTTFREQPAIEKFFSRLLPEITANFPAEVNYAKLRELLTKRSPHPRVLVVGCGEAGQGMAALNSDPTIELTNTDVAVGDRVMMICDSHNLPFADGTFDGVIIQAVLEHVADPYRCVEEVHRVLGENGIVYAETPFMQQVHGGPFDFTRFTDLGHRRLFRHFEEISSGPTAGSALAFAWAFQYFLLSLVTSSRMRAVMKAIARLSGFWLKYIDRLILTRPGTYDAALGFYFLGTKSREVLSDRELIRKYRGGGGLLPSQA
jgi:SAM-dependent methyltransferase